VLGPSFAPLHRRFVLLVGLALLPSVVLSAAGLYLLSKTQRDELHQATVQTTRALVSAVDNEISRSVASLEVLGVSPALRYGAIGSFEDEARSVLDTRPAWATIILRNPAGVAQMNLRLPQGARPADSRIVDRRAFDDAVKTRHAAVGSIGKGPFAGELLFPVHVPVVVEGRVRHVLSAVVRPEALLDVIQRQRVPAEGVVAIFDANGNIVARSRDQAKYVGHRASDALLEQVQSGGSEGWVRTKSQEGEVDYAAYSRSATTGWTVAIGIPRQAVDSVVDYSYLALAAGVLLSLLLGAAATVLVARRIERPMEELRAAAVALGRGEQPAPVRTHIPEIREVSDALSVAAEIRRGALEHERAANRTKDEFLAMLGHELRNPVAAISNAWMVLNQKAASMDETATRAVAILGRQLGTLSRLIDDLLDVGRVTTGKILLEREVIDLAEYVQHAVASLRVTGRLDRHPLSVDAGSAWMLGDPTRIEQIVVNLVTNAVKYTPPGGRIQISVAQERGEAVLQVKDEGIGIEPELIPRVFDLFVQGPQSLDRAAGGLGIGLTLVRRLAELHGGKVLVESDGHGKGSLFVVRFPAVSAPVPDTAAA
jgi:signal transduction histidine kinase